jgi:predicted P-loop ATPase
MRKKHVKFRIGAKTVKSLPEQNNSASIGVVACALKDDVVNDQMLVLIGAQGKSKSRWLNGLVPKELKKYYYSGPINPRSKDSIIQLGECVFINSEEMTDLKKNSIDQFKELVTKQAIKVRRPYCRYEENISRIASFMGSTNHLQFIPDPTGSRRFLAFEVFGINLDHEIQINAPWAQAVALFEDGYQYWFSEDENEQITEHNKPFMDVPYEEEVIFSCFRKCEENEQPDHSWTTTELLTYIRQHHPLANRLSVVALGKALNQVGFRARKTKGIGVYDIKIQNIQENGEPNN